MTQPILDPTAGERARNIARDPGVARPVPDVTDPRYLAPALQPEDKAAAAATDPTDPRAGATAAATDPTDPHAGAPAPA